MDSAADSLLALSNTAAAMAAQDDPLSEDDRSSSLSELDENLDEDSDAQDSEPAAALEADSEAETERLQVTPENLARKKPFEISPSKLAHREDIDMRPEIESLTESAVTSPISSHADSDLDGVLSDPPEGEDDGEPEPEPEPEEERAPSPNKRKRDESESEVDEAPRSQRRRTGSVASDAEKSDPESDVDDSRSQPSREPTLEPEPGIVEREEEEIEEEPEEEQKEPEKAESSEDSKGRTRSRPRRKAKGEAVEEPQAEEEDEAEPAVESDVDENDAEAAAKSEEEQANRMAAMDALIGLEKHFAALRDRLYDEKIAGINHELALLSSSRPSHPELLRQLEAVQKYRDEKYEVEQKLLVYKVGALKNKSVAERSQIHSQYFQTVRDIRERHLERLSEHFYRIQRDRFKTDSTIPNFTIPFPERRSQQILQQTAYNKEVSILSGIAKYVGFPAAPELAPSKQKDLEDDMQKMGISTAQTRPARTQRPAQSTISAQLSGPQAEEQFLEQTPWANPQHPIHRLAISRQNSNRSPLNNDVFLTPASQQRSTDPAQLTGSASTIVDPAAQHSSVVNTPLDGHSSATKIDHQSNTNSIHNDRLHSASPLDTRRVNAHTGHPNTSAAYSSIEAQHQQSAKEHIRDLASSPLHARANFTIANSPTQANSARPEKVGRLGNNESPFRHKDAGIAAGVGGGSGGVGMGMGRFSIR